VRGATASQGRAGSVIEIGRYGLCAGLCRRGAADGRAAGRLAAARQAGQSPAAAVPPGYLAALARACGPADAVPPRSRAATAPPGLVEPLTGRELEVLRLLAAGRSNQRIARDLVVALDTVKKHVTHLLGKLSAATEAAARARQLGLIP
jgi:LuxR family maltose regulon positive regulatory protein